jgi:hypothetical protein
MSADRVRAGARIAALAAAWVGIGIHLDLVNDHLDEKTYIGVLFVVASALLVPVVYGLSRGPSVTAAAFGGLVNAGMAGGFVTSRTVGLPGGFHESWTSDHGLGLVALATETVFLIAAAVIVRTRTASRPASVHGVRREFARAA